MALRDWILDSVPLATATPATFATLDTITPPTVATVATVSVASREKRTLELFPKLDAPNEATAQKLEGLRSCPLCDGILFHEGSRGGYFCIVCQEMPEGATIARVVQATVKRPLLENDASSPGIDSLTLCPLCNGDLYGHGLDGCFHLKERILKQ